MNDRIEKLKAQQAEELRKPPTPFEADMPDLESPYPGDPAQPLWTVTLEYHSQHHNTMVVHAPDVDAACHLATNLVDIDPQSPWDEYDDAGPTYVAAVAHGEYENAFLCAEDNVVEIPAGLSEGEVLGYLKRTPAREHAEDLLAALRSLFDASDRAIPDNVRWDMVDAFDAARAVIAKAEGKA